MVSFSKELSVDLVLHDTLSHGLRGAGGEFRRFAHEASEGAEQSKAAMAALRIGTHLLTGVVIGLAAGAIGSLIESFKSSTKEAEEFGKAIEGIAAKSSFLKTELLLAGKSIQLAGDGSNRALIAIEALSLAVSAADEKVAGFAEAFQKAGIRIKETSGTLRPFIEIAREVGKLPKDKLDEFLNAFGFVSGNIGDLQLQLKQIAKDFDFGLIGPAERAALETEALERGFKNAVKAANDLSKAQSDREAERKKAAAETEKSVQKAIDGVLALKEVYRGINDQELTAVQISDRNHAERLKNIKEFQAVLIQLPGLQETLNLLEEQAYQNDRKRAELKDAGPIKPELKKEISDADKAVGEFKKTVGTALVDDISSGATKAIFEFEKIGDAVEALTKQIAQDLVGALIKLGVQFGLNAIFPGLGILGAAAATGGVTQKTGTLKGYAGGGIATEPLFLVGEGKNNEAIIPLPDNRSVPVTLKDQGGRGRSVVNVNFAINAIDTRSVADALDDHRRTIVDIVNNAIRYDYPTRNRIREAIG